jgi:hypothetical protein
MDANLKKAISGTRIDLKEQIKQLSNEIKSELDSMVASTTANALAEFKKEMMQHYNNHMITVFKEHMTAFKNELIQQFEILKHGYNYQVSMHSDQSDLHTQQSLSTGTTMEVESSAMDQ